MGSGRAWAEQAGKRGQGGLHNLEARTHLPRQVGPSLVWWELAAWGVGMFLPLGWWERNSCAKTSRHPHRDVGATAHHQLSCFPSGLRAVVF